VEHRYNIKLLIRKHSFLDKYLSHRFEYSTMECFKRRERVLRFLHLLQVISSKTVCKEEKQGKLF